MTEQLRELCQNIHLLMDMLEAQRDRIAKLERVLAMLQPRFDIGIHTFRNEAEAEMAWPLLHTALYGPDAPVPPMPRPPCECVFCPGAQRNGEDVKREAGLGGL